ncbi:MAG: hypothetical protein B5M51_01815 [Anaerolinea sp. 4484_236]|nr:MAG: hypothetical protein B5M51_01815 [Anaerolinea sp. 4484_236]
MTCYLSVEQILFIHARLIDETGGGHGVRDLGLLQSATARPQATYDGDDLYIDIFSKAAALLESLVNNHPFLDGNKRTGVVAAGLFLRLNGRILNASNKQLLQFTLGVAQSQRDLNSIAKWLKENSKVLSA